MGFIKNLNKKNYFTVVKYQTLVNFLKKIELKL